MVSTEEFLPRLHQHGYITGCTDGFTAGLEVGTPPTQLKCATDPLLNNTLSRNLPCVIQCLKALAHLFSAYTMEKVHISLRANKWQKKPCTASYFWSGRVTSNRDMRYIAAHSSNIRHGKCWKRGNVPFPKSFSIMISHQWLSVTLEKQNSDGNSTP